MKKLYSLVLAIILFSVYANAQSQLGELRGKVIDAKTKKSMDFVSVGIFLNGIMKATAVTDDEGNFIVKSLQPGTYEIKVSYIGYRNMIVSNVDVVSDKIRFQNINMESNEGGKELEAVYVKSKPPLIDPDGKAGATKTSQDILNSPTKSLNMIAGSTAGVDARAGGTPNFRGARADGTAYYIDGMRINGNVGLPTGAIDQIDVITAGFPAQYGDFNGGVISQTTKSPSKDYMRYFDYRTSTPFNGYLDNSQFNDLQLGVSGPLKMINKGKGDKERVLFGFSVFGEGYYQRSGIGATPIYKVSDDVLKNLEAKPLTRTAGGAFINSAEFLNQSDLTRVYFTQNVASQTFSLSGNFTYQPASNINIKLGYQANYGRGRAGSYSSSLMDYSNNPLSTSYTIRPYIQFTQMFNNKKTEEEAKKSLISNAYYTVRLSYEQYHSQSQSAEFGDDIFSYGYVGKFKTYSMNTFSPVSKQFSQNGQQPDKYTFYNTKTKTTDTLYLTNYWKQDATRYDTLTKFEQASINIVKGNYTKEIFDYYNQNNLRLFSLSQLSSLGGLRNGDEPIGVYSNMWTNVGTNLSGYGKSQNETYALWVMSEASVGTNPKRKHDLQFGFTYEQQVQRGYSLGASGLWSLMMQLVNQQFAGNDSSKAILKFNANGVFQDTVRFAPLIVSANQKTFDANLRSKLMSSGATDVYGNPITANSRIDVNLYNPSTYSLKMFSADDLLNNGNSVVSYYGYDYLGNQVNGKQSIDKFLTDRTIGAFQPIYMAAWVQDKFVFKDLIVRMGVRMERYDANQLVLKDPYSLAPVYTAADVQRNNLLHLGSAIPSNIGSDYAVYIDNEKQVDGETHISGFRNGNDWYDANGNHVTDPKSLYINSQNNYRSTISRDLPYLVNAGQKTPGSSSFTDYVPDVKFLPRLYFSFPISSTSQFFGTYDVLAQRPTGGLNVARFDDYYYLNNRLTGTIGNPDLKMTQVTDYNIGFSQQISENSAIKLTASYREFRNLLQIYRYVQAWPYDYTAFGNLDFSTVKSLSIEYTLRDLGNVNLSANYSLQFADGTGSNAGSSGSLVASGLAQQRNIFPLDFDTRHALKGVFGYGFRAGKDYDGPKVSGKKILERAAMHLNFNYVSGRPYTQILQPMTTTQAGIGGQRTQVKGTYNSANLPDQFFVDLNIDKYFIMRSTSIDGKNSQYVLRIYLEVQNLFNAANVLSVFQYTGSAYSDGYLNSPQATAAKANATNTQSFIDLYNIKMVNPGNFAPPRLTRFGISLQF